MYTCFPRNCPRPVSGGAWRALPAGRVATAVATVMGNTAGIPAARPAIGYLGGLSSWLLINPLPAEAERKGLWAAMAEREAMAEQEACGARQLEVPRRRFCGRRELGSIRAHSPVTAPAGGGAAMAATRAAGLEGRGRNVGTAQGQKANLSQRVQELRAVLALQGAAPSASRGRPRGGRGGSWSPHRPAWYQQRLNFLQRKGGSFSRSHVRKSSVRTESCSPACVRRCRRTSMPWALSRRYGQVPSAVPLPGAGPAGPAPPPVLSRSRQHRAAIGCDRPQAGGDCSLCPSPARSTTSSPPPRLAERSSTWASLWQGRRWR